MSVSGTLGVVAFAGLVLVAGCTSSGGAGPTGTSSLSSTAVASSAPVSTTAPSTPSTSSKPAGPKTTGPGVKPGEKPPTMAPLAKRHSRGGALLFAAYYFNALDWSLATTDSTLLRPLAAASCKTCAGFVSKVDGLAKAGYHDRGGRISVQSAGWVTAESSVPADYFIEIGLRQTPGKVVSADGRELERIKGGKSKALVGVKWNQDRWLVTGIGEE